MPYNKEGNFAGPLNDLNNSLDRVDRPTAQEHGCNSTNAAGPPPPASQNHSYILTSSINTTQRVGYSWPLVANYNISNPDLSSLQINTDPEMSSSLQDLFPELRPGVDGGAMTWDPTERYDVNGNLMRTSFQPESEFIPDGNFDTSETLVPEPLKSRNYHDSTPPRPGRVSTPNRKDRQRSEESPASPNVRSAGPGKYTGGSDTNSNSSRATNAKKTYMCTVYNCGKIFGRSAELKRHENSVHKLDGVLFHCPHGGCERVGKSGFKRKDNLVQHLRGVHGDPIGKKSGRRSATTGSPRSSASTAGASSPTIPTEYEQFPHQQLPQSSASTAGAGSPTVAAGYRQFFQGQQQELLAYTNQQPIMLEEGGSPPLARDFWENIENWRLEG